MAKKRSRENFTPHLLKSLTKIWCGSYEPNLEIDTWMVEENKCSNCLKLYKKALLRENKL